MSLILFEAQILWEDCVNCKKRRQKITTQIHSSSHMSINPPLSIVVYWTECTGSNYPTFMVLFTCLELQNFFWRRCMWQLTLTLFMVLLHYCSNLKKKIHSSTRGLISCPYKQLGHIIMHSKTIRDTIAPCRNVSWQPHKPTFQFLQDIHLRSLCENNMQGHFENVLVTCWVVPHPHLQHKAFCISPVKKPPDSKASDPLTSPPNTQFYPIQTITITSHTQPTRNIHFPCWIT